MLVNHFGELDTKIIVTFIIIIFRSEYRYKQKSAQSWNMAIYWTSKF